MSASRQVIRPHRSARILAPADEGVSVALVWIPDRELAAWRADDEQVVG